MAVSKVTHMPLTHSLAHTRRWDTMAMGNFPFPSDYLVFQQTGNSKFTMPAFPVRVACDFMTNFTAASRHGNINSGIHDTRRRDTSDTHAGRNSNDAQRDDESQSGASLILSDDESLLAAMQLAVGVLYNVTHAETCLALPDDPEFDGIWDYQWCSELLPQETYVAAYRRARLQTLACFHHARTTSAQCL
jgi:lysosomal Pro-X carboxypeptidase